MSVGNTAGLDSKTHCLQYPVTYLFTWISNSVKAVWPSSL